MKPAHYPLTIYCGTTIDDAALNFTYKVGGIAVVLTGCAVRASCRNTKNELMFDWSTANGKLTLDAANGYIGFNVSAEETALLNLLKLPIYSQENNMPIYALGMWNLEITSASGRVERLLQGPVYISKECVYG